MRDQATEPRGGLNLLGSAENVADYYDQSWFDYRLLWMNRRNRAMHLGYWAPGTRRHSASLLANNAAMCRRAGIRPGDCVLDAGCGVGGTALWLAKHRGADVTGVTVSSAQAARAAVFARREGLSDRARFAVQDFTRLAFPDASFDVVYGIESVCHARDKRRFIEEAFRVLKPGGRLVVHDGFRRSRPYTPEEEQLCRSWLHSWAVPDIATVEEFTGFARQAGFEQVVVEDHTEYIRRSVRRLYRMTRCLFPFAALVHAAGLRSAVQHGNVVGARDCWRALERGLWFYGVFSAIRGQDAGPSEVAPNSACERDDGFPPPEVSISATDTL